VFSYAPSNSRLFSEPVAEPVVVLVAEPVVWVLVVLVLVVWVLVVLVLVVVV
jgi:hypothetical protein